MFTTFYNLWDGTKFRFRIALSLLYLPPWQVRTLSFRVNTDKEKAKCWQEEVRNVKLTYTLELLPRLRVPPLVRHRGIKGVAICSVEKPLKNTCADALSGRDLLWSNEAEDKGQTYCLSTSLCSGAGKKKAAAELWEPFTVVFDGTGAQTHGGGRGSED